MTKRWKSGWDVILQHPLAPRRVLPRARDARWKDGGDVITMSREQLLAKKVKKMKHIQELFASRAGAAGTGPGISGHTVPTATSVPGVPAPTSAASSGGG